MSTHHWSYGKETRRCDLCGAEQTYVPKPGGVKKTSANWVPPASGCMAAVKRKAGKRKRTPEEFYDGPNIKTALGSLSGRRAVNRAARLIAVKPRRDYA